MTAKDIAIYNDIFGPSTASLKGKIEKITEAIQNGLHTSATETDGDKQRSGYGGRCDVCWKNKCFQRMIWVEEVWEIG